MPEPNGSPDGQTRYYVTVGAAILAIVAFAFLYGWAMVATWTATATPKFNDAFSYFASLLAGLIGGIVAAGFNQRLPTQMPAGQSLPPRVTAVGALVIPRHTHNSQQVLGSIYAVVYFLFGVAAAVTWIVRYGVTPDLVRGLAGIATGLLIAVVRAFFV